MPLTLDNPFSKPSFETKYSLPINTFGSSNTNVATFGDTRVVTNNPILSNSLPINKIKRTKSQAELDFDSRMKLSQNIPQIIKEEAKKDNWWNKKNKSQKSLIIGGGVVTISVLGYLIYKLLKK